MTAAPWQQPSPAAPYAVPRRPQLTLVPDLTGRDAGGLRLTRRGWLAIAVVWAGVLIAVSIAAWPGSSDGAASGQAGHRTVSVTAGQTLSQIAARELPSVPLQQAVADLELANNLASTQVRAGQVLVVPQP